VVSAHREENVDDPVQFAGLIDVLRNLAGIGRRVIMTSHPRKRIEAEGVTLPPQVELLKPFGFSDYINL